MTAYVLLSGGIDSTTCLYIANLEFGGDAVGVSVDYGQRHHKEMEYAKKSCDKFRLDHYIFKVGMVPKSMLTDVNQVVPDTSYDAIVGVSPMYVPFRNGLMLSTLTSWAVGKEDEKLKESQLKWDRSQVSEAESAIFFGAHAEDAQRWAYPDCTPEFIGAMANAIYIGTYRKFRLHTPLQWLRKAEIIALGQRYGVDWAATWSCYKGGEKHCGTCATCQSRRQGFIDAHVYDPTEYEELVPV